MVKSKRCAGQSVHGSNDQCRQRRKFRQRKIGTRSSKCSVSYSRPTSSWKAASRRRTAELEQAKQDYAVALSRNDYNTAAEAQARMTATQQAIADIQNGQVELSEYAQKMQQQAQQPQQPAPQLNAQNIDQFIETQLPDLLPSEKEWLKSHPDALLDAGNQQRLNIAFHDSVRDGLKRGTPEYFRHMDRRLGYESEDYSRESSDPTSMVLEANRSKPQRRSRGGREVTLSKEERDMARLSGISEEEYGRQKLHLQDLKKSGYYTQE
jgi:hypothetical protein